MADYFVIKNDKVENIILCDSKEIAEMVTGCICIERTEDNKYAERNYLYNSNTNTFSAPEEEIVTE